MILSADVAFLASVATAGHVLCEGANYTTMETKRMLCKIIKQYRPYQSGIFIQPFIYLSSIDSIQKYSLLAKFIANETLSKSDFKSNLHPHK